MWDLSSPTRGQTSTPCIGRQSLCHWTAREVPLSRDFFQPNICQWKKKKTTAGCPSNVVTQDSCWQDTVGLEPLPGSLCHPGPTFCTGHRGWGWQGGGRCGGRFPGSHFKYYGPINHGNVSEIPVFQHIVTDWPTLGRSDPECPRPQKGNRGALGLSTYIGRWRGWHGLTTQYSWEGTGVPLPSPPVIEDLERRRRFGNIH